MERTQVAIVGGGPAGMLLSHLLHRSGIDNLVIERQTKAHVLRRIRAGVLEPGTVKLLREAGLGERMDHEGHAHDGSFIAWQDREPFLINTVEHCGQPMWSYGQTAITEELYRVREREGGRVIDGAENVRLVDLADAEPKVTYEKAGRSHAVACDFIAGCDGFHGVSRQSIPATVLRTFERAYPFGWLGIMSETPPVGDIIYARHERGFALASRRNPMLSRYYIQCGLATQIEEWPDDRFGGAETPVSARDCGQDRHRAVDREIDRAIAQLRRRTNAIRAAFPRRRCRPHRSADRGQGPEPRGVGRVLPSSRVDCAFSNRRRSLPRRLFRRGPAARMERGALLLASDEFPARLPG